MFELLGIAGALFVAWLLKQAFAGKCSDAGVSQAYGAWVVLKYLFIATVVGFIGLVALAAILAHMNGPN